jgi:hypothetical protein
MTKTLISLATASLIASSAMAADKGVEFTTTGQAVVYYQTNDTVDLFNKDSSNANVGVQLNIGADIGNGFTLGTQLTYIDALGLNKNLVADTNVMQVGGSIPSTQALGGTATTNDLALTKIFVAKQIANTTLKIGRQELPKSLSPLAYSEDWNVFKNTFEAVVAINTDIPDTTIVAAQVGAANRTTGLVGLSQMQDLTVVNGAGLGVEVDGAAYMLTVANTSLPMTTVTASYYALKDVKVHDIDVLNDPSGYDGASLNSASAAWLDIKVADKSLPMGLKAGIQAGSIMTDHALLDDTTAFGVKVGAAPVDGLNVCAAFTSVDGTDDKINVAIKNVGTGVKTPLFTQMILNQNAIALDADTVMLSGAYSMGDAGTVILRGSQTTAGKSNLNGENDFTDLELIYKVKAGGVNFLAAYVNTEIDTQDAVNTVRVWARYSF